MQILNKIFALYCTSDHICQNKLNFIQRILYSCTFSSNFNFDVQLTCWKHLHDRIISLRWNFWAIKQFISANFIEVHVPRQESDPSCICIMVITFDSFNDFCIRFCNCYENVILFGFHFISRNATSRWIHWTLVGQRHTWSIWCLSLVSSSFIYICSSFVCFMISRCNIV